MNNVKLARKFLWVLILTTVCSRGFAMSTTQMLVNALANARSAEVTKKVAEATPEMTQKVAETTPGFFAKNWGRLTSAGASLYSEVAKAVISNVSAHPKTAVVVAATAALLPTAYVAYKNRAAIVGKSKEAVKAVKAHPVITGGALVATAGLGATAYTGHLQTGVNSLVSAAKTAWNSEAAKTVWGYTGAQVLNHPRIAGAGLAATVAGIAYKTGLFGKACSYLPSSLRKASAPAVTTLTNIQVKDAALTAISNGNWSTLTALTGCNATQTTLVKDLTSKCPNLDTPAYKENAKQYLSLCKLA